MRTLAHVGTTVKEGRNLVFPRKNAVAIPLVRLDKSRSRREGQLHIPDQRRGRGKSQAVLLRQCAEKHCADTVLRRNQRFLRITRRGSGSSPALRPVLTDLYGRVRRGKCCVMPVSQSFNSQREMDLHKAPKNPCARLTVWNSCSNFACRRPRHGPCISLFPVHAASGRTTRFGLVAIAQLCDGAWRDRAALRSRVA